MSEDVPAAETTSLLRHSVLNFDNFFPLYIRQLSEMFASRISSLLSTLPLTVEAHVQQDVLASHENAKRFEQFNDVSIG